jgi:phenylpyruvate tautomerase PptA (4-oxalocrotonate tautomerase family)
MPYLQVDVTKHYSAEVKRDLAQRMGGLWAEIMQTTPDLVDVGFRELGEGNVWRCGEGVPEPSVVMLLEMRKGRPPGQRAAIAHALVGAVSKALDIRPDHFTVEFTQHAGDESYREYFVDGAFHGGFAPDWTPEEGQNQSFRDTVPELQGRSL